MAFLDRRVAAQTEEPGDVKTVEDYDHAEKMYIIPVYRQASNGGEVSETEQVLSPRNGQNGDQPDYTCCPGLAAAAMESPDAGEQAEGDEKGDVKWEVRHVGTCRVVQASAV